MVFTIPKRFRVFFGYDRKLLGELAGCALRALKLYFDGTFDGADVISGAAGFLQPSPDTWCAIGASTRMRGKRRKVAPAGDTIQAPRRQDDDEFTRRALAPMPSWARLIRRVYEVDPLLCPFCGSEMKILAFIVDFGAAKAIRKSLELPAQEPEPLAHAPPEALELVAESA